MKVETIYVLERLNTGNYCHLEMSATAKLEDGEEALTAMLSLKALVNAALTSKSQEEATPVVVPETPVAAEEVVTPKKERKTKEKKAKEEEIAELPPVITEEVVKEKKAAKVVVYNRSLDTHKAMLSSHLSNNFPNWKTHKPKPEIMAFTSSLEGKEFLDDKGLVLDSFKTLVGEFFA